MDESLKQVINQRYWTEKSDLGNEADFFYLVSERSWSMQLAGYNEKIVSTIAK